MPKRDAIQPIEYVARITPQEMNALAEIIRENLDRACGEEIDDSPAAGTASIANLWLVDVLEPLMEHYEERK